jgi:hypothetical protein
MFTVFSINPAYGFDPRWGHHEKISESSEVFSIKTIFKNSILKIEFYKLYFFVAQHQYESPGRRIRPGVRCHVWLAIPPTLLC